MKCPRCGEMGKRNNYCDECGSGLKEKCRVCGKMEWIGVPICENVIAAHIKERLGGIQKINGAIVLWSLTAGPLIIASVMLAIACAIAEETVLLKAGDLRFLQGIASYAAVFSIFGILVFLMGMFVCGAIDTRRSRVAEEKFWVAHSDLKVDWDKYQEWLNEWEGEV